MNGKEVEFDELMEEAAQDAPRIFFCKTCNQIFGNESKFFNHTLTASHQRVLLVESRQKAAGESSSGGSQNLSYFFNHTLTASHQRLLLVESRQKEAGESPYGGSGGISLRNPFPQPAPKPGFLSSIARGNVVGKFVDYYNYTPSKKEILQLLEELKLETDVEKKVAKAAFKSLLEYARVEPDWTLDDAMNEIIKFKVDWYEAHLSIQERKYAFNEYQGQSKVQIIEDMVDETKRELERLRAEQEERTTKAIKEWGDVSQMEEFQNMMSTKVEISYEKQILKKYLRDAETKNQEVSGLQYEQKALDMARSWAKDEAIRVREQAKVLQDARRRSETLEGIKFIVDNNDLRDDANAGPTWVSDQIQFLIEETKSRAEDLVDKLKALATDVKGKSRETIDKVIQNIVFLISQLKKWE